MSSRHAVVDLQQSNKIIDCALALISASSTIAADEIVTMVPRTLLDCLGNEPCADNDITADARRSSRGRLLKRNRRNDDHTDLVGSFSVILCCGHHCRPAPPFGIPWHRNGCHLHLWQLHTKMPTVIPRRPARETMPDSHAHVRRGRRPQKGCAAPRHDEPPHGLLLSHCVRTCGLVGMFDVDVT